MPKTRSLHRGSSPRRTMTGPLWSCVCWHCKAWQGCVCVLWVGHFKGKTWLSPPFTVGVWHWRSVCTAASFLPAHKGAHASVHLSANWWLAPYESVCACVCLQQALAKRFVWASVGRAGHSPIPSPRASIIQFPRMLQPIPTPLHTHALAHIYTQTDTHSPC